MGISISIGISPRESLADWSRFTGELEDRGVGELWLIDSQLAMKDEPRQITAGFAGGALALVAAGALMSLFWFGRLP